MGKVVRMNRAVSVPVLQLFQRPAAILEDLAIYGFDLAIRGQDGNGTRYPIDCRAQTSLAFTQRLLGAFPLAQIEDERDALVALFVECRRADQHGHTAAVLAQVLLLEGLRRAG